MSLHHQCAPQMRELNQWGVEHRLHAPASEDRNRAVHVRLDQNRKAKTRCLQQSGFVFTYIFKDSVASMSCCCGDSCTSSPSHLSTSPCSTPEHEQGWMGPWAPLNVSFPLKTPHCPRNQPVSVCVLKVTHSTALSSGTFPLIEGRCDEGGRRSQSVLVSLLNHSVHQLFSTKNHQTLTHPRLSAAYLTITI